jgi:hypothetical protein
MECSGRCRPRVRSVRPRAGAGSETEQEEGFGVVTLGMDLVTSALTRAAAIGLLPSGVSVLLAVSGGADSTALLYGAAELVPETGWILSVAHVHHGWRGRDADRDLLFVEKQPPAPPNRIRPKEPRHVKRSPVFAKAGCSSRA